MRADGRPLRSVACNGLTLGAARRAGSGTHNSAPQATSSAGKPQPIPFSVTLGCDKVRSVLGQASAARFPPELSPAMMRARSVPVSSAWREGPPDDVGGILDGRWPGVLGG